MYIELFIIFLIFAFSYVVILKNFKVALYLLLILSVLLHKELFSFYRWDLMPVRAFMLGLFCAGLTKIFFWFINKDKKQKKLDLNILKDPFIILVILLWVVRGASMFFSLNLEASLLIYSFFTTIVFLVIYLINYFKNNQEDILKYIKAYIYVLFGLTLFGYFQYFLYVKTGVIIGAFWNIPGNIARVGAAFWDVNHYAALLAAMLPISGVLFLIEKNIKKKLLYSVVPLSLMVTLFLTNSRSAWIMEGIAALVFVILFLIRKFGYKSLVMLFAVILLFTTAFTVEYSKKDSPMRAKVKQYFHYRMDSFDSHILLLTGATQIFTQYPILGGGYGGFFEHFSQTKIAPEFFGRDPAAFSTRFPAHTLWGELLAETGIIGFSVWLLISLLVLTVLLKAAFSNKDNNIFMLASAMFSIIIGWFVAGIFYSYNAEFFWIVFCLFFSYGVANFKDKYEIKNVINALVQSKIFLPLTLISISAVLIFGGLSANHLIPWDEAIYAKISKNMVLNNEYITMNWKTGVIWYEKPPLYMWLMAFSMKLLGFTSLAARLPSAIFGFATVILVYIFGKKLFNRTAGFLAAFSLLTTLHFLYYSRQSMTDITNVFFITLALYLYWLAKNNDKLKYWVFSGISIGLAVMTKGVIGFLPLAIIGLNELFLLVSKRQKLTMPLFKRYLVLFVTSVLIFLPWHVEMYRRFGMPFINNYLGYHVLARATEAIEDKGQPWWWYFISIKVSMRIWFVALVLGLPWFFSTLLGLGNLKDKKLDSKFVFLFIWAVFTLVFFSVAKSKLVWYIIPIYPVLSLIVGAFSEHLLGSVMKRFQIFNNVTFKFVIMFFVIMFSITYVFYNAELYYPSDSTGSQARLMMLKDELLGTDNRFFLDRIELPIAMFYTDSPFEVIDYQPQKGRTPQVLYEEEMTLLGKKGRFAIDIPGIRTEKKVIAEDGDWILWSYDSEYKVDKDILQGIQRQLTNRNLTPEEIAVLRSREAEVIATMTLNKGRVMYYLPEVPIN